MRTFRRVLMIVLVAVIVAAVAAGLAMMTINSHVQNKEKENIIASIDTTSDKLTKKEIRSLKKLNAQCILVLGCGIKDRETPSPMLKDRLDTAISLYQQGLAPKLLFSGDNGTVSHNEVHVMLSYAKKAGVPKADIFCDHAGFSTYDSMYRANSIFQVSRAIVVTQTYHMYRALYIGEALDLMVKGVASNGSENSYKNGQPARELREVLARNKDFFKCIRKPEATYGGEVIPITGSGVSSHGE